MSFASYVKARYDEPSTHVGLGLIATAVGVAFTHGGSKQDFAAAFLPVILGLVASFKADPAKVVGEVVGPVAVGSLSAQVVSLATELAAITAAVAPVVAAQVPVVAVRDTIGK